MGKNADSNDELVNNFRGKENLILHTVKPGSPFCVIEKLNPTSEEIKEAATMQPIAAHQEAPKEDKKEKHKEEEKKDEETAAAGLGALFG